MEMELNVTLPIFEGPLDLLLHLLEKNEVDIYDIPIALITEQFLAYLSTIKEVKLEMTSEFVVMAAHLLEIKSRMLLPIHQKDEESGDWAFSEEDPRFDLVQRLIAYRIFKEAAQTLEHRQATFGGSFFKDTSEVNRYTIAVDFTDEKITLDVAALSKALQNVIDRLPEMDLNRRDYFKKLHRDAHTVSHKMTYLKACFMEKSQWRFSELVTEAQSKLEVVVTFLALLELMKAGEILVKQTQTFDDIEIEVSADTATIRG